MLSLPRLRVRKKKEDVTDRVVRLNQCNTYGSIDGVKVGTQWLTRKECSGSGVHRPTVSLVHAGPEGAYSILVSANCQVQDYGFTLIYSGSNGRTKSDSDPGHGTLSLVLSDKSKLPVRIVRSSKLNSPYAPSSGYRYDGVYTVTKWWEDIVKGRARYRFKMLRLDGQDPPTWGSCCRTLAELPDSESESEEPRILSSRHFRIQGSSRPVQHPSLDDVKPFVKIESSTSLFPETSDRITNVTISEEEVADLEIEPNPKFEKSEQFIDCFVDVENLSHYSGHSLIEEIQWDNPEESLSPDTGVYEEENKPKVDLQYRQSYFNEEEEIIDRSPVHQPGQNYVTLLVEPDRQISLPLIHNIISVPNTVSGAEESEEELIEEYEEEIPLLFPQQNVSSPEEKFIVLDNLNAVPAYEWEQEDGSEIDEEIADPLSQMEDVSEHRYHTVDRKVRSNFEKQEMTDMDNKAINGLEHNCFFDISLRDIVKMVTDMEGCPCSWTDKQQLASCHSKRNSLLPPLVVHYLKNIIKMAEAEDISTKQQTVEESPAEDFSEFIDSPGCLPVSAPLPPSTSVPPLPLYPPPPLPPLPPTVDTLCSVPANTNISKETRSVGTNTTSNDITCASTLTDISGDISSKAKTNDKSVMTENTLSAKQTQTDTPQTSLEFNGASLPNRTSNIQRGKDRERKRKVEVTDNLVLENGLMNNNLQLKKEKLTCPVTDTVNNGEINEPSTANGANPVKKISLQTEIVAFKFQEEWAQPHLYKVHVSKSFEDICDELCSTLPESIERPKKKSAFRSRHVSNNHLKLNAQKHHTAKKVRRRQSGFTGFTENQQRHSRMRTSMMYGFYIDNCNFRGWNHERPEKSFIAGINPKLNL